MSGWLKLIAEGLVCLPEFDDTTLVDVKNKTDAFRIRFVFVYFNIVCAIDNPIVIGITVLTNDIHWRYLFTISVDDFLQ